MGHTAQFSTARALGCRGAGHDWGGELVQIWNGAVSFLKHISSSCAGKFSYQNLVFHVAEFSVLNSLIKFS